MKRAGSRLSRLTLALGLLAALAACHAAEEEAATQAADQWLALVDSGQYAESWKRSTSRFRESLSTEGWETTITAARQPLGELVSRELGNANYTDWLPGGLEGDYVLIQYRAEYENKKTVETVTASFEEGEWRISSYLIR